MILCKTAKNCGSFTSNEALMKLFYLILRNIRKKWMNAHARLEGCGESICDPL